MKKQQAGRMRLFWSSRSPHVRKVMVVAHEVGVADRIQCDRMRVPFIDHAAEQASGLTAANPLRQIPTLVLEDGEALFDSLVICDYLDLIGSGAHMLPALPRARIETLQRHALGNGLADIATRIVSDRRNPALAEGVRYRTATLVHALDHLEKIAPLLNKLAPDLGHIAIATALAYMDFRLDDLAWRKGWPDLDTWYGSFAERASMKATEYFDELASV